MFWTTQPGRSEMNLIPEVNAGSWAWLLGLQPYPASSWISCLVALQPLETNPRPSALFLMDSSQQTLNHHLNPRSHACSLQALPIVFSGCLLV